jgi:hypothetical protein
MSRFLLCLGENGIASLVKCQDHNPEMQAKLYDTLVRIVGGDMDELITPDALKLKGLEDGFQVVLFASKNYNDRMRNPFFHDVLGNVVLCIQNTDWDGLHDYSGLTMKEISSLPAKFTFPNF